LKTISSLVGLARGTKTSYRSSTALWSNSKAVQ